MEERRYDLEERLLEFAARVMRMVERFSGTTAGRHVGGQLIRSSTAPLAHHGEAQGAESRRDFVHELKLAHKELCEFSRWLRLALRVPLCENKVEGELLLTEANELIRIFYASIRTASANPNTPLPESTDPNVKR